jgi:hypothetical protein
VIGGIVAVRSPAVQRSTGKYDERGIALLCRRQQDAAIADEKGARARSPFRNPSMKER